MFEPLTWRLLLRAAPNKVFCSLVRAATEEGRVCGVEDYGIVLRFASGRRELDLVGQMRASVNACPEGTLDTITAGFQALVEPATLAIQART